jgi:plastocyanin/glucose/arabinose dehydrogenase
MLTLARGRARCARGLLVFGASLALLLVMLPQAAAQQGSDILLPAGYQVKQFATGFTAATAMDRAPNGDLYVLDSASGFGFPPGSPPPPIQVWRVTPGGTTTLVWSSATSKGLSGTALGIAVKDDDNIFVNDGTGLNRIHRDGSVQHLLDLPTLGDHNADHIAIGKDGKLYWGQGSATNSGVVGEDNYTATQWLKTSPTYHDIPCKDVQLSGQNFTTKNPLSTTNPNETVSTGPYLPFGTPATPGQVVKGQVPCTSSILRANMDGSGLEMVAWGFRNPFGLAFAPGDSPLKGSLVVANNGADVRGSRPIESDGDDLFVIVPGGWYGWPDNLDEQPTTESRFSTGTDTRRGVPSLLVSPTRSEAIGAITHFQKGVSTDGFDFSTSDDFGWKGDAFLAQWGALGFGAQPPEGLPGFNVVHVHFMTDPQGVLAGTTNNIFMSNRMTGAASTSNLDGLEHPIDVKFSVDGKTMFVLDYGVGGKAGSGKIWAVTRTGGGAPGFAAPPAAAAPAPTAAAAPAATPTPAPAAAAAAAPASGSVGVAAKDFVFDPTSVTVTTGTTVTWTNTGSVAHTVTWNDRSVDSGLFEANETFSYTFSQAGTYGYFCIPHGSPGSGMAGTVVVTGS